jgi:hypothetical protein
MYYLIAKKKAYFADRILLRIRAHSDSIACLISEGL